MLHWGVVWGLRLAIAAPLLAAVALLGFRIGLMDYRLPLLALASACVLAAIAFILALIGAFSGGLNARVLVALVLATAFLIVPLNTVWRGAQVPPIHDITTDLKNPPRFEAVRQMRAAGDNSLAIDKKVLATQKEHYTIRAHVVPEPPIAAFDYVLGVVQRRGWQVQAAQRARGHIEATATTPLFGFKDDIVIRLSPEGKGTRVDMRSASRVGMSDLGANAARIQSFMAELAE